MQFEGIAFSVLYPVLTWFKNNNRFLVTQAHCLIYPEFRHAKKAQAKLCCHWLVIHGETGQLIGSAWASA